MSHNAYNNNNNNKCFIFLMVTMSPTKVIFKGIIKQIAFVYFDVYLFY